MKTLSIIIPTYNMESLLGACLDSLVQSPALARMEVVVVNDGSRDGSLDVARRYADQYGDSVRIIDKENGNYGSTINAALPTLQGRYVKILDADDCFDASLVESYIETLERAEGVDMVVTPYIEQLAHSQRRVDYNIYGRRVYEYGRCYDAEQIFTDGAIRFFAMHAVAYRTALLRDIGYRQSEGISYTDQEWVFYPLFEVQRILFADIPLYIYNLAREGQTMNSRVMLRSLSALVTVAENMSERYASAAVARFTPARRRFLKEVLRMRHRVVYRLWLFAMPDSDFSAEEFTHADKKMATLAERCGLGRVAVPVNNILGFDMLAYWRKHSRRYPSWLRSLLRAADGAMVRLHALLFGRR